MTTPHERREAKLHGLAWAILWSVLFTALLFQARAQDFCYVRLSTSLELWTTWSLAGLLLLVFFALGNRGRLFLAACGFLAWILFPHVTSLRGAAVEAQAVAEMRAISGELRIEHEKHPSVGFPTRLPRMPAERIERLYRISYQAASSVPGGPADLFLLQFVPVYRECGCVRSFAATQDGVIHFAIEDRPATPSDPSIL